MTIINLTPHDIVLRSVDGTDHIIPKSGMVARVTSTPGTKTEIPGCPVQVMTPDTFGEVINLPDPTPDTMFLVSAMVGSAMSGKRSDILVPGTGPNDGAVRNDKGHILAVTCLKIV